MKTSVILWCAAINCGVMLIVALIALRQVSAERRQASWIQSIRQRSHNGTLVPLERSQALAPLAIRRVPRRPGFALTQRWLLPPKTVGTLEAILTAAARYPGHASAILLGSKLTMQLSLCALVLLLLRGGTMPPPFMAGGLLVAAFLGWLAPDFAINHRRATYLMAVERGLPDALDLMIICINAGMGIEAAVSRVAADIRFAHRAVAMEFQLTASELRMHTDDRVGLTNLGARTGLPSLKRLGSVLVQSVAFGTPLVDALKGLSADMRQEMITRYEARAARLPVLLTLPLILFILPCLFLVIAGPAAIQVLSILRH